MLPCLARLQCAPWVLNPAHLLFVLEISDVSLSLILYVNLFVVLLYVKLHYIFSPFYSYHTIVIDRRFVEKVDKSKCLTTSLTGDLYWTSNTIELVKKVHHPFYLLWIRRKNMELMMTLYRCSLEGVLAYLITVCYYANYSAADKWALQRVIDAIQENNWLLAALLGQHF